MTAQKNHLKLPASHAAASTLLLRKVARISFFSVLLCGAAHVGYRQARADDPDTTTSGKLTFNNTDTSNPVTYSQNITGSTSVVKNGAGTDILSGQGNTYTGPTLITQGALQFDHNTSNNQYVSSVISSSNIDVSNNGSLIFNQADSLSMSNPVTGDTTGTIKQNGTGSTTLVNTSGYKGALAINKGTLQLGDGQATGNFGQYTSITNNGTLTLAPGEDTTLNQPITGSGSVRLVGQYITTLGYNKDTDSQQTNSPHTVTLTGNNTYNGETQIAYGTLSLGSGATLANSVIHTGYKGIFNVAGAYGTGTGTVNVKGILDNASQLETGGIIKIGNNTLEIAEATPADDTIDSNQGTNLVHYAGSIQGGTGGLTLDSGRLAISGNNTYTGATTINNDALLELDGDSKSSQINVTGGGTFRAGGGALHSSLSIDGTSTIGPGRAGVTPSTLFVKGPDATTEVLKIGSHSTSDFTPQYSWATNFGPINSSSDPAVVSKNGTSLPSSLGRALSDGTTHGTYANQASLYSGRLNQGNISVSGGLNLSGTIKAYDLSADMGSGVQNLYQASSLTNTQSVYDTTNLNLYTLGSVLFPTNAATPTNYAAGSDELKKYLNVNSSNGFNVINLVLTQGGDTLKFWNGDGTSSSAKGAVGGNGTWTNSNSNWVDKDGNSITSTSPMYAVFMEKGGTVSVNDKVTVSGMQFAPVMNSDATSISGHGSYTLSGSSPIILDGQAGYTDKSVFGVSTSLGNQDQSSDAHAVKAYQDSTGLLYNPSGKISTIRVGDATNNSYQDVAEIDAPITDTNTANGSGKATTLVKTDTGLLILGNSNNTYTGGTVVTDGTLQISDEGALGSGAAAQSTTLSLDGGALAMGKDGVRIDNHPILLSTVGGTTSVSSGGQLNLNGHDNTTLNTEISGPGSLLINSSYIVGDKSGQVETNSTTGANVDLNITHSNTYTGSTVIEGLGKAADGQPAVNGQLIVNANTDTPFGDSAPGSTPRASVVLNANTQVNMNGSTDGIAHLGAHDVQVNSSNLNFNNSSTADNATITTNSVQSGASYQRNDTEQAKVQFNGTTTAANSTINNFYAGNNNGSSVVFTDYSTADNAKIYNSNTQIGAGVNTNATNQTASNTQGNEVDFERHSKAANANITNAGSSFISGQVNSIKFSGNSEADSAQITNTSAHMGDSTTVKSSGNLVEFTDSSKAYDPNSNSGATIDNIGSYLKFDCSADKSQCAQAGRLATDPNSTWKGATINNYREYFVSSSGGTTYTNPGFVDFDDGAHAGNAIINNGSSTASTTHNTTVNNVPLNVTLGNPPNAVTVHNSNLDDNEGNVVSFYGTSSADTATINNTQDYVNAYRNTVNFNDQSTMGTAVVNNKAGSVVFQGNGDGKANTGTIVNVNNGYAALGEIDLSNLNTGQNLHIGSVYDDATQASGSNHSAVGISLGNHTLYVEGNDNKTDTRSLTAVISDATNATGSGAGPGNLVKEGAGTLILKGGPTANSYTGYTETNDGLLDLQASVLGDLINNGNNDGSGNTIVDEGVTVGGSLTNNAAANGIAGAGITDLKSGSVISKDANQNSGQLQMEGGSTIKGTLYANGGHFWVTSGSASAGSLSGAAPGRLDGTLILTGNASNEYDGVLFGAGGLTLQQNDATNATQKLGGKNTYSGTTTIAKGRTLALTGNGRLLDGTSSQASSTTTFVQNDGTLDIANNASINNSDQYSLREKVTGNGNLIQESDGITELLSGSNYAGNTIAKTGVVQVDANSTAGSSGVNNEFQSGSTLAGQGSIAGNTTIDNGATLQTGDYNRASYAPQNFEVNGNLNLNDQTRTVIHGGTALVTNNNGSPVQIYSSTYGRNFDQLSSDLLTVTGTATLGGTLEMRLPTGGNIDAGQAYRVMKVKDGVNPNQQGQKTHFGPLEGMYAYLTAKAVVDQGDGNTDYVDILLLQKSGGFSAPGRTPNEIAAGHGLDHLPTGNPLRAAVNGLPTAAIRPVLNNLSGEIHASVRTGLIQDAFLIRNAALNRLANDDCAYGRHGQSTYDMKTHRKNDDVCSSEHLVLWGQAYGSMGHNSGTGNAAGMGHNTAGFIMGADTPIRGTKWHAGGLVGYGHSGFNAGGRSSSASSNNITVGGYAGTHWGHLHLRLGGTYSWNLINTRRQIAVGSYGGRVTSHYLGGTGQAFAELGYRMHAGRSVIEPFMNVAYVNMQTNGFRERGNDAALLGRGRDTGVTFSTFGVRAGAQFVAGKTLLMPHLTVAYRHGFGRMLSHQRSGFAASGSNNDMNVAGVLLSDNAAVIDTGITARITDRMDIDLSYIGQYGNHSVDSGATGSVRMYF